jgi:hypothetical protein
LTDTLSNNHTPQEVNLFDILLCLKLHLNILMEWRSFWKKMLDGSFREQFGASLVHNFLQGQSNAGSKLGIRQL